MKIDIQKIKTTIKEYPIFNLKIMKKTLLRMAFATVIATLGMLQVANAGTGACSGHDGVDCSAGADTDGSVICNDGWTGSSVLYSEIKDVCGDDYIENTNNGDNSNPFSDLYSSNKNKTAILYLYENEVISGYPDGTFKPSNTVNRAELLKILVGGKGVTPTVDNYKNCFPDVKEEWFAPYVCYAKSQGWVSGYPDSTFKPSNEVNKVEAIKMLVNSQGYLVPDKVNENSFSDVNTSEWFAPFVEVAKSKGLLEEIGNYFSPADSMSRAGISENIYRAMIVKENTLNSFSEYNTEIANEEDSNMESEDLQGEDIIETHYREWTVNEIQVADSSFDFLLSGENNKFVGIHLTNKNTTDVTKEFSNVNIWIKDAAGNEYPWEFSTVFEPALHGGILEPNEARSGWATFEAPAVLVEADLVFVSTSDEGDILRIKSPIEIPAIEIIEEEDKEDDIIQISNLSIQAFWKSWDADAEEDGFELSSHFKNEDGESVWPKVNDWSVEMEIYDAEVDYSKYNNFDTHKTTLLHSISFTEDEVKYSSINLPYVRVAEEDVTKLVEGLGYVWIEATFTSEKQGVFSASKSTISFYKGS